MNFNDFWWFSWFVLIRVLALICDEFQHRFRLHFESLLAYISNFVGIDFCLSCRWHFYTVLNQKYIQKYQHGEYILAPFPTLFRRKCLRNFLPHFGSLLAHVWSLSAPLCLYLRPTWYQTTSLSAPETAEHLQIIADILAERIPPSKGPCRREID